MKIILCIFLLNITAVSVFGQSVELNGILGESVKFPAAVKKGGYLMYGTLTIGESSLGTPGIGNYKGRLHWDSSTGLFSLSGLREEDIGEYKVQNTDPNITRIFQLNVHKDNVPVSKPHVSITQNEYPCTLLCAVERGTGVTLSWYREDQKKPYVTSPVQSAPHLHLPVPVDEGGIYTCEAKNSVSNETSDPLTVGAHCTDSRTWIIVASVIAAVAILIAVVFAFMYHRFERRRRAVRTLIQAKMLLDNVDVHAYGDAVQAVPQSAVGSLIEVKKILDNVDPQEYAFGSLIQGFERRRRAVKTFIEVKKLFDNVDPHECGDAVQAVPQFAVGSLFEVKKILDNVDPQEYAFGSLIQANRRKHSTKDANRRKHSTKDDGRTLIQDGRTLIQVKELLDTVDLHASVKDLLDNVDLQDSGERRVELSSDAVGSLIEAARSLIQVKELLDDVDPSKYAQSQRAYRSV